MTSSHLLSTAATSSSAKARRTPRLVLFDLDGTLADTAPDLINAVLAAGAEHQLTPRSRVNLRALVGRGGGPMIEAAFGNRDSAKHAQLIARFLAHYGQHVCTQTALFPGMRQTLYSLAQQGIAWGVVTNKPHALATRVMYYLNAPPGCAIVVGAGAAAAAKPSPLGLWLAASKVGIAPAQVWYVGDDERDIVAAHSAGMVGVAASWGYIPPDTCVARWGADLILGEPGDLSAEIAACSHSAPAGLLIT